MLEKSVTESVWESIRLTAVIPQWKIIPARKSSWFPNPYNSIC